MMIKQWYTAKELSGLPGLPKSDRNIRINANKNEWQSRPKSVGKGYEYHIESLPVETQAYLKAEFIKASVDPVVVAAKASVKQVMANQVQERKERIASKSHGLSQFMCLSDAKQIKAKARELVLHTLASFIQPFEAAGAKTEGTMLFVSQFNEGQILLGADIRSKIQKLSVRQLYRWQKAYNESGILALTDQYKQVRLSKVDAQPRLGEFIQALVTSKPHLLNQAKKVRELAKVRADEYSWELPSVSSFNRWLVAYSEKNEVAHAFITNPTKYTDKYRPLFGRMYPGVDGPNQVWEFDSTPTDVELNVDGKLKRFSVVAVIDVYTHRAQVIVSPSSNSEAICLLLRKCLLEWGIPEEGAIMRTDNGSDYVSKRTTSIFGMLDLSISKAAAFSGWEKPFIERFFGTMSRVLMEKMPGYIGHSVTDRQQIEAMHNFAMRIGEGKKKVQVERLSLALTPQQLQQALNDYLEFDYNHIKHDKIGKSPFELYAESGYKKRVIENEHVLDILLNNIGTATVVRGSVKAGGVQYTAPELMETAWQRKKVRVFVDPNDIGKATLYPNDSWADYVEAVNMDLVNKGISPVEYRERRKAQQKDLTLLRKTAKRLQEDFGISTLYADELAQKKADAATLTHFERKASHSNQAIAGLSHAAEQKTKQLSETELAAIERQREAIAKRKENVAAQESRIVRSDHEKAVLLTEESLTRELAKAEKEWLKKYRLNNVLQRNRLDRILKKAEQHHRQVK